MKRDIVKKFIIAGLTLCLLVCPELGLTGCGSKVIQEDAAGKLVVEDAGPLSMEATPVVDYTVPRQTPNVLVSRLGYGADNDKKAYVRGKTVPDSFRLIDASSGETVYTGVPKEISEDADTGLTCWQAVFSEVKTPGTYYVECTGLGRSYDFDIKDNYYTELFNEVYAEVCEDCSLQKADLKEVLALLTVYEWYPQLFTDEDLDGTPDVLTKMAVWIQSVDETAGENNSSMIYSAILAKFSYLYQKYDKKYATECVQRASAIYEKLQGTLQDDGDTFLTLTELFRATGIATYNTAIEGYATYFNGKTSYLEQRGYLLGSMTYLSTRQAVDRDMCGDLMNDMMAKAEEVGDCYEELTDPFSGRQNSVDEVIIKALDLVTANRVLDSYLYYNEVMTLLHYLCGANIEANCFYPEDEYMCDYILIFGHLAYNELGLDSNSRVG